MGFLNKVMIIGNLGGDPEVRHLESGQVVANLNVATNRKYKTREGELREETEWHRVSFWNRQAEVAEKYLQKGSSVYVEGRLKTRKWQDKEGNDRYTTEIQGLDLQMLGRTQGGGGEQQPADTETAPTQQKPQASNTEAGQKEDLPVKDVSEDNEASDDLPF